MIETVPPREDTWNVEPGSNGTIKVRVPSCDASGHPLPDAIFTFRPGDPQYDHWAKRLRQRNRPSQSQSQT